MLGELNWEKSMKRVDFKTIYHFLDWYLSQRTGRAGKFKRPVKSKGSLITFWCCFRLAFRKAANFKIDVNINRHLLNNVCPTVPCLRHCSADWPAGPGGTDKHP